ncbi:hypothetical protein Tco_0276743 [Tanacetum coccineum]
MIYPLLTQPHTGTYLIGYTQCGYGILDLLVDPVALNTYYGPFSITTLRWEENKIDFSLGLGYSPHFAPSLRKCLVDLLPTTAEGLHGIILLAIFQDKLAHECFGGDMPFLCYV